MKTRIYFYGWLLTLVCLSACNNKSDQELEKEMADGVALVRCESYYELQLADGESIYFSDYDAEKGFENLETDKDSIKTSTSFGTAFFISDQGELATNNHVVAESADEKEVQRSFNKYIGIIKSNLSDTYDEYYADLEKLKQYCTYAYYSSDVSVAEYNEACAMRNALQNKMQEMQNVYQQLDNIDARDAKLVAHHRISIAYNNTFVTEDGDFIPAVVTKTDETHDLAIIQLKNKQTPEGKHIFAIPENDPFKEYSFTDNVTTKFDDDKNSQLMMCSFNLGPMLALTKEGVKCQYNNGKVSQETEDRLMYSIPALPGSSGSPVVNRKGELVAVNFASVGGTQSFNYGVRVKHLKALMDK